MNITRRNALILLAVCVAAGLLAWVQMRRPTVVHYYTSSLETGDIKQVVEATGTINAVTTVQVGSQVSGVISGLFVDFNSQVKKGQVIAQIEPALFQGAVAQAKADVDNAEANVAVAIANIAKAKANAVQMKADYERNTRLKEKGATSDQLFDVARANSDSAEAQVEAAIAQERQARAQVLQKQAAMQVAQTNFDYTTIHAPIDGTVVARNVDVGQTVAASLQAPTLFTIAQDLTKMQVYAKTDESDVGGMRRGQTVTFKVDAYPRETFTGIVSQVRMNSTVVQNVVTYDTIVDFDNPELKLFPGMTAYVTIPVASVSDVIKIPNAALRFKPDVSSREIETLYRKYGVPVGDGPLQTPSLAVGSAVSSGAGLSSVSTEATSAQRSDAHIVWMVLPDRTLKPLRILTGITDHTWTALVRQFDGGLKAGDELVAGVAQGRDGDNAAPVGGPGSPRRR